MFVSLLIIGTYCKTLCKTIHRDGRAFLEPEDPLRRHQEFPGGKVELGVPTMRNHTEETIMTACNGVATDKGTQPRSKERRWVIGDLLVERTWVEIALHIVITERVIVLCTLLGSCTKILYCIISFIVKRTWVEIALHSVITEHVIVLYTLMGSCTNILYCFTVERKWIEIALLSFVVERTWVEIHIVGNIVHIVGKLHQNIVLYNQFCSWTNVSWNCTAYCYNWACNCFVHIVGKLHQNIVLYNQFYSCFVG